MKPKYSDIGVGWHPLVDKLVANILEISPDTKFGQIKEKYGTLRVYCSPEPDAVYKLISQAEQASESICEICGKPGVNKPSGTGWWRTRCEEHREVKVA